MISTQYKKQDSLKSVVSSDNKKLATQFPLGNFSIQLSMFPRTVAIFVKLPLWVHIEDMLHGYILLSISLKIQFNVINHKDW